MTFGMNNTVNPTPEFKRDSKPLLKKHRTLKQTITNLEDNLIKNPYLGDWYGQGIYKIRIKMTARGKERVVDLG
jgi:hypothetical protein